MTSSAPVRTAARHSDDDSFPTQPIAVAPVPARAAARFPRLPILIAMAVVIAAVVIAAVVIAAVTGAPGHRTWASWSAPAASDAPARSAPAPPAAQADDAPRPPPPVRGDDRQGDRRGALAGADGAVPDGATVFDDDIPGVANLDPDLLGALRRAATEAADDGVTFTVNSGWRSAEYQAQLLRDAVAEYGSQEEAARWVATPDTSPHVSGDAVDVGPADATAWLSAHGDGYGLCQIYRNEPWHYELRPDAVDDGCPAPYADPTHDPRMQR